MIYIKEKEKKNSKTEGQKSNLMSPHKSVGQLGQLKHIQLLVNSNRLIRSLHFGEWTNHQHETDPRTNNPLQRTTTSKTTFSSQVFQHPTMRMMNNPNSISYFKTMNEPTLNIDQFMYQQPL
jgi:hypothetical protein